MRSPFSLSFGSLPSIVPSYARIVFRRKLAIAPDGMEIPRLEAVLTRYKADRSRVEAYRAVCGGNHSEFLPVAYPHVLATPVQLALLSSKAFPVRLMGLVHLRNHIEQVRPLRIDETGQIRTWLEGRHDTDRGQEFDVRTELTVDGRPVWSETCVFMARRLERDTSRPFGARISAGEGVPAPDAESVAPPGLDGIRKVNLTADKGIGWRYARASSDYNPIHLADFAHACSASPGHRARHVVGSAQPERNARGHFRPPVPRRRGVQAPCIDPGTADARDVAHGSGRWLRAEGRGQGQGSSRRQHHAAARRIRLTRRQRARSGQQFSG
jgi:hypothetical protein